MSIDITNKISEYIRGRLDQIAQEWFQKNFAEWEKSFKEEGEKNKALAYKGMDCYNKGPEAYEQWSKEFYYPPDHPKASYYNLPSYGDLRLNSVDYLKFNKEFSKAFDVSLEKITDLIVEGDWFSIRYYVRVKQKGAIMGIPNTGKEAVFPSQEFVQIQGTKCKEGWALSDSLEFMKGLGLLPKDIVK